MRKTKTTKGRQPKRENFTQGWSTKVQRVWGGWGPRLVAGSSLMDISLDVWKWEPLHVRSKTNKTIRKTMITIVDIHWASTFLLSTAVSDHALSSYFTEKAKASQQAWEHPLFFYHPNQTHLPLGPSSPLALCHDAGIQGRVHCCPGLDSSHHLSDSALWIDPAVFGIVRDQS